MFCRKTFEELLKENSQVSRFDPHECRKENNAKPSSPWQKAAEIKNIGQSRLT